MPISRDMSKTIVENIVQGKKVQDAADRLRDRPVDAFPLPPRLPRETQWSRKIYQDRLAVLESQGITLQYVNARKHLDDPSVFKGHVENFIGTAQVPIGVVGPLRVNGAYAHGDFYVPLATTEGALVAAHNRGARVISMSGGARVICLSESVSRAPGFVFQDLIEAGTFIVWVNGAFDDLKEIAQGTTRYGHLEDMTVTLNGNHVYLNFEYTTGDAAGQNMVTIATEAVCRHILRFCPVKPRWWFIESNLSGDKKATARSSLFVRGKKVTAEIMIPGRLVEDVLHTTPERMMEYWKMAFVGGVQSGSIGVQGHYANGLAALFIACGQDAACVSEASVGITRLEPTKQGDVYFCISLPNLIVGTVGGGTDLPTQRECLEMIGCKGEGTARKFAEICAATVLAGEISITAALAAGHFTQAHVKYGREGKQ